MRNESSSTRGRTSTRSTRSSAALRSAVEPLESRQLLSTINWTNRGVSDGFTVYGVNANTARGIVDRAIDDWEQVISNFNFTGGGNTFNLTVTGASMASGSRGVCNNTTRNNSTQKKPISADITLDNDGGGSGWYFDPSMGSTLLPDDVEFDSLLTPFTANATGGQTGNDFYRTIVHEVGHAMGVTNDTTGYLRIGDFLSNGVADPNNTAETLRLLNFNGGATDYTLTSDGGGHMFEGGGTYTGPTHPNDLMNDGRTVDLAIARRQVISDTDASLLRDVYGYTITMPSTFHTLYVSRNAGNGQVVARGLAGNSSDTIVVDNTNIVGSDFMSFTVNGITRTIDAGNVNSIVLNGNGGTDYLRLESTVGNATTLSGGDGDDFFDFGFTRKSLGLITGNAHVQGGNGSDQIFCNDNNQGAAQTFTITSGRFDRPGWGGFSYASDIEFENLTTGTGADTVNVLSTFGNQPVWIWSAGGADTVNIGSTLNGLQSIHANVTINNDPALTTLNINNGPDTGARTWNVDRVGNNGYLVGMAPARIYWDNSDIQAINLMCGSGVDTGYFVISTETFNVNNAGADDFITLGVTAAGGMQLLSGQITIDNGPAYTTLTLDDNNDSTVRNVVVDEVGGYNTVTGICPALIRFDSTDVSSAAIFTGLSNDTVSVPRNDEVLNILSFGGVDGVTIGNATNGVQSITGAVSISSPFSPNVVTINNGPDATARIAALQSTTYNGNTYYEWTGLAPAAIRYRDQLIANVTFGSAADTVLVRQTQGDLNLTTTGGVDTYTLGSALNGAQSVLGTITLTNPPNHNIITVDDASNSAARTATLDDVTLSGAPYGQLIGLAPATINWKYNDTTSINLIQGSGFDTLTVRRHQKPLAIQGTGGGDLVTLGGVAGIGMNGITASTTVSSSSGVTTLVLNDSTDSGSSTITHEMNTLLMGRVTGMSPAPVDYRVGQVNTVRLRTSLAGSGNIVVIRESSPLTRVFYDPGANFEALYVNDDGIGSASIYTDRSVRPGVAYAFSGGAIYQLPGGFVFRAGLQILSGGLFDISDGALIYDYDEGNPIDGFKDKIIQGYNGGNWQGLGIRSSTAAVTPSGCVGYADAANLFSTFPATFAGQSVDATTVLVRYTLAGDADLNRNVNFSDLLILAQNYGQSGRAFGQGDFNYDGNVNFNDLLLQAQNYGSTLLADGTFTPATSIPQKLMNRYFGDPNPQSSSASARRRSAGGDGILG